MWIEIFTFVMGILLAIVIFYILIVINTQNEKCPLGFQVGVNGVCTDVQDNCPPPTRCQRVLQNGLPICLKDARGHPVCLHPNLQPNIHPNLHTN